MSPLDAAIRILESQPEDLRQRFRVSQNAEGVTIHHGGMQAHLREAGDDLIEVRYEHALHELTNERLPPPAAVRLVVAIIQREGLGKIDLSTIQPKCDLCGTINFVPDGRAYELTLKCSDCNIVFCVSCAGREQDHSGIKMLRCPKCMGSNIQDIDLPED